jgi:hypothetical protein
MSRTLSKQSKQGTYVVMNKRIDGFTSYVDLVSLAGGFSPVTTGDLINPDELIFTGTLSRDGEEYELFSHTLRQLVIASYLLGNPYLFLIDGFQTYVSYGTVGAIDYGIMPLRFDLGGPLNLMGSDRFSLRWQLNDAFFLGNAGTNLGNLDSTNTSVEIDECETTEIEYFIPKFTAYVIDTNQNNFQVNAGDNVLEMLFINYDKQSSYTEANAVLNSLSIKTNHGYSKDETQKELITKAASYFPTVTEFLNRRQSFCLYAAEDELDGVIINMSLKSSNVNAGKNWIFVRSAIANDGTRSRGNSIAALDNAREDKFGSFNPAVRKRQG